MIGVHDINERYGHLSEWMTATCNPVWSLVLASDFVEGTLPREIPGVQDKKAIAFTYGRRFCEGKEGEKRA